MNLCKCGCGRATTIAKASDKRWGRVKGQYTSFIAGHGRRGIHESDEVRIARYSITRDSGCVEWTGASCKDGYALFTPYGQPIKRLARYLWEQKNGPLSPVEYICHRCDNPSCINLAHCFVGTTQDNMDDMKEKSRQCQGERHANTTLTISQVRAIRRAKCSNEFLTRLYLVGETTISNIKAGRTWKNIK